MKKTLTIFSKDEPKTYGDSDFHADLYKTNQTGLFYCKTLSHTFNGPFYGFTPDSDPGEYNFVPELFFIHGPTFIKDEINGHCHLKTLLSDPNAMKRLIECIEKVLEVRNGEPFENKYGLNLSHHTTAVNIQYAVARDFKNEFLERLACDDITVEEYNQLMDQYDNLTLELRNVCEKRDTFIQGLSNRRYLEKEVEKLCPVSLNKVMGTQNALKDKFSEIRLKTNKDMELTNAAIKSNHIMASKVDNLKKELREIPGFVKDLVRGEVKELVNENWVREIVTEVVKEEMAKEAVKGKTEKQKKAAKQKKASEKQKKAPEEKPEEKPEMEPAVKPEKKSEEKPEEKLEKKPEKSPEQEPAVKPVKPVKPAKPVKSVKSAVKPAPITDHFQSTKRKKEPEEREKKRQKLIQDYGEPTRRSRRARKSEDFSYAV